MAFRLMAIWRCAALVATAAVLWLGSPARAPAEVTLVFYGHNLSVVGDRLIHFPHALIGLEGTIPDSGEAIQRHFEFEPAVPPLSLLPTNSPGRLKKGEGAPRSTRFLAVRLSDEAYRRVAELIAFWGSRKGSTYNLYSRNCVHFVAEVAEAAELDVPPRMRTRPSSFLAELRRRNTHVGVEDTPQVLASAPAGTGFEMVDARPAGSQARTTARGAVGAGGFETVADPPRPEGSRQP